MDLDRIRRRRRGAGISAPLFVLIVIVATVVLRILLPAIGVPT
jgi:hypothetical protein